MGLRDKLSELLSRGTGPEPDPDEMVDVEDVYLPMSQVTVEALRNEGIEAEVVEVFNAVVGAQDRATIRVPRHQHAQATAILDRLR
jgi:hypothetical protein